MGLYRPERAWPALARLGPAVIRPWTAQVNFKLDLIHARSRVPLVQTEEGRQPKWTDTKWAGPASLTPPLATATVYKNFGGLHVYIFKFLFINLVHFMKPQLSINITRFLHTLQGTHLFLPPFRR